MSQTRRICNVRTQGRTRERRTLGRALALTQPKTQNTQHTNIKRNEHVTGLQFGTDGSADPWWSTAQHKYGVEMCTRLSWARASSWAILNCCFAVSSIHTRGGGQERRANLLLHFPVSMETDEGRNRPNELPLAFGYSSVKGYGRFLDFHSLLPTMTGHSPLALHLSPRQRNSQSVGDVTRSYRLFCIVLEHIL